MRIYLVQHGKANPKEVDPERNLTTQGRKDVERISAFLKQQDLCIDALWHSGKARASQTAEILGSEITASQGVLEREGLSPNDAIGPLKKELFQLQGDVMIVGHLPFLSKLASELVTGSTSVEVVYFQPGGVVCLERTEDKTWVVRWVITPELLP